MYHQPAKQAQIAMKQNELAKREVNGHIIFYSFNFTHINILKI